MAAAAEAVRSTETPLTDASATIATTDGPPSAPAGLRRQARVDLAALAANLRAAVAAGGTTLDARADAYGHSLRLVAPVARSVGIRRMLITDEADAALAASAGYGPAELAVGRLPAAMRSADVHPAHARAAGLHPDRLAADPWGLEPGAARPVMTLVAEVIAVKRVGADAGVSYGYSYRTPAPTTLALVGLGYADGVPRLASNRAAVLIEGVEHPIVGRIAMDQFVVDCAGRTPALGSEVVLFGSPDGAPTAVAWATATGRSATDLTAGLGVRVHRVATHAG